MQDIDIVSDLKNRFMVCCPFEYMSVLSTKLALVPFWGLGAGLSGDVMDLGLGLDSNERTLTDLLCPIRLISHLSHQPVFP